MTENEPSKLQIILSILNQIQSDIKAQRKEAEEYCTQNVESKQESCRAKQIFDDKDNEEGFFSARNYVARRRGLLRYVVNCLLGAGWVYSAILHYFR